MLPIVLLLALSGAVVTAKGPGGWLYTKANCTSDPDEGNEKYVQYSRRHKLNGNHCLKEEGIGGYEATRRLSLWLSAAEDKRVGCLWMYRDDQCTEGENMMQYELSSTSDTCWTYDPSTMGSNKVGFSSYWYTEGPCSRTPTIPVDPIDVHE